MKKIIFSAFLLAFSFFSAQNNTLLEADFWKSKPDLETVKTQINSGNDAAQLNPISMDPVTLAINNGASAEVIKYLIAQPGNGVSKLTHDGRNYLHWAAMQGNTEIVNYLISKGADINLVDSHGTTPIEFGAASGNLNPETAEAFFKAGISPTKKYENGANLLLLSIANDKNFKLSNYLISKGLSFKNTDSNGATAFDYAAKSGNIQYLTQVAAKGTKPTGNALLMAAIGTRRSSAPLSVFQYLVDDLKLNPSFADKDGNSVLHIIAKKPNQLETIQYFLSKNVDVNKKNADGENVLMLVSGSQDLDAAKAVLAKTKDINAKNEKGESALNYAVTTGSPEILQLLISSGADAKTKDVQGKNLVYTLVNSHRPQRGPENSVRDIFAEKAAILKTAGLDLSAPQTDGNTVYHIAAAKNDLKLLEKISNFGADINAKNNDGITALHQAALVSKDDTLLKFLLSKGAKKDVKSEFGETAFDIASENDYLKKNHTDINFLK